MSTTFAGVASSILLSAFVCKLGRSMRSVRHLLEVGSDKLDRRSAIRDAEAFLMQIM